MDCVGDEDKSMSLAQYNVTEHVYIHVQFIFYVISLSEWVLGHMVFVLHNTSRLDAMSYSSSACFRGLLGTKGYIYTSRCYLSVHVHVE